MKQLLFFLFFISISISCKNKNVADQEQYSSTDASPVINKISLQSFFQKRRERLLEKTGKGIILLRADYGFDGGRHEYRAANNFYYLTGSALYGSVMMLDGESSAPYTLFIMEKGVIREIYTGNTPSFSEIKNSLRADTVISIRQSDEYILKSVKRGLPLYIDNDDKEFSEYLRKMIAGMKGDVNLIRDISPFINELRVIKDSLEIADISKAVDITGKGFLNTCHTCLPGMFEYELEAMIEYTYRKNGSPMPGFGSIVGSGPNAVTLHYETNTRKMEDGDLVLMDVGAEYGYNCADITRTIPVNGKFNREQKDIYELVLRSQKAAIAEMIPGRYLVDGQNESMKIIIRGLYDLGLITDTASVWQRKFYLLHGISHYLGMDVHDVGDYGTERSKMRDDLGKDKHSGRLCEKGMVMTVEPGLYFRSNGLKQAPELFSDVASAEEIRDFIEKVTPAYEKYMNIGVRIEDDVLITDSGNIVLSKDIPKEIADIEQLMDRKNHIPIPF